MASLNPDLVAWNESNRRRRDAQSAEFRRNLEREDVAILADLNQRRLFEQGSSSYDTFLRAHPYESTVRSIVSDLSHLPLYRAQKDRARQLKLKVGQRKLQQPWMEFLKAFLKNLKFSDATPSEIWSELIGRLDELECRPEEVVDRREPRKTKIVFEAEGSGGKLIRHSITYGYFLNLVSRFRPKKS